MTKRLWARGCGIAALGAMALLTACDGFFVNQTSTSGSGSTASGDYVYVVNQTTNTLSGFVVGTNTLTSISTYVLTTGLAAASVAVTIPNTYVYVGGFGEIACYSIGAGGALSVVSAATTTAVANFVSMDVSSDGRWLIALDSIVNSVYVYSINTSTGILSLAATVPTAILGATARQIRFSPNAAFAIAALGAGGDLIYPFNDTTGALSAPSTLTLTSGYSDNAVAFDTTSGYAYIARGVTLSGTSGIATYTVGTGGSLTPVGSTIASGSAPYSLLPVTKTAASYLYAANKGDGTISGYTLTSGVLAALGSSPYVTGTSPTALVLDQSKNYVVAVSSGGAPDIQLFSFDATTLGKLDSVATAQSGTDPAGSVAVAATH